MRYLYVFGTLIIALAVAWLAGFPGWVPFDPRRLGDLISALNPASAESAMHPHLPPALQTALSAAIVAAIAVIVVLVPARSIRRISAGNQNTVFEEERQSVWSWEGARRDLGVLLARRRGEQSGDQEDQRKPPHGIREAYRRLLRREAVMGRPRRPMDTPFEFVDRLSEARVAEASDARTLTAAYVRERYGAEPATEEETAPALTAWASFEATSRDTSQ